jgi:Domain of unknown function (DUF4149)
MLVRISTVVEALALAVWVGALAGFAFVFAPLAFGIVTDLDRFAELAGRSILALTQLGYVCGAIAIVAAIVRSRGGARLRVVAISAALLLSAYDAQAIVPQMQTLSARFGGSFAAVPPSDPRRVAYDDLHRRSSEVYGLALLLGLVAIALAATSAEAKVR